jgi:GT2 family glycosyltransferase
VEFFGANLGSAAGHNRLAAESDADVLLFLNPDARMAPDAVELLVRALRADVGIVEARQVPLDHPKDYEPVTGDTSWASTACAVTPRELFERLNGFDAATFFLYGDDVDYSWRARLAGRRVVFEPSAAVFHDKRLLVDAGWPVSPAEQYYSAEASLLLAYKYSNVERVDRLLGIFESSGEEFLQRVLAAFHARRAAGELPTRLDPEHTVARFIGDHYAQHRF